MHQACEQTVKTLTKALEGSRLLSNYTACCIGACVLLSQCSSCLTFCILLLEMLQDMHSLKATVNSVHMLPDSEILLTVDILTVITSLLGMLMVCNANNGHLLPAGLHTLTNHNHICSVCPTISAVTDARACIHNRFLGYRIGGQVFCRVGECGMVRLLWIPNICQAMAEPDPVELERQVQPKHPD